MKHVLIALVVIFILSIHVSTAHADVVLEVESMSICYESTVPSLIMDNPDDTVGTLQVDILFDTECIIVMSVDRTERSEPMDIFNHSEIDGGIRIAMTGIGHVIEPGSGPIAKLAFTNKDCADDLLWNITGCVVADHHGGHIACFEIDNPFNIFIDACILDFSERAIEFGSVLIGDTATTTLTIWNVGNTPGDVSITVNGCATCEVDSIIVTIGGSQSITIGCCPAEQDSSEGTITFSGCACGDQTVTISCRELHCEGKGDMNDDGYVNVADVVIVVNLILDISMLPPDFRLCRADCNDDGVINILDVLAIVNEILGIGTCGP